MNLAQMREWAAYQHSAAVRANVATLCDALDGALQASNVLAEEHARLAALATLSHVWIVRGAWVHGSRNGAVAWIVGVASHEDAARAMAEKERAELHRINSQVGVVQLQDEEEDGEPDAVIEWGEYPIADLLPRPGRLALPAAENLDA